MDRIRKRVRELTNEELLEDPFEAVDLEEEPPCKMRRRFDPIGMKLGESSFTVDPIIDENKRKGRLPREDGKPWPTEIAPEDLQEGDEGGYFEGPWRSEEEFRRQLLESNPDYHFFQLVAGATNMEVEQLFVEGDIYAAFRRERALMTQQRIAIEEVRTSIKELEEDIQRLDLQIDRLTQTVQNLELIILTADSLISRFSFNVNDFDDKEKFYSHLLRQTEILEAYTASAIRSSATFANLKTEILEETKHQVEQSDKRVGVGIEVDEMEKLLIDQLRGADASNLLQVVNFLIQVWMYIEDLSRYTRWTLAEIPEDREVIKNEYVEGVLGSTAIGEAFEEMISARESLLRVFTESLRYFLFQNILVINPEDIGVVGREGNRVINITDFPFDETRAEGLFVKYGGRLFAPPKTDIRNFHTSVFQVEYNKFTKRVLENPEFKKEMERGYFGPFVIELKAQREGLKAEFADADKRLDELTKSRRDRRDKLSNLRAGTITFRDLEQPYGHRRGWVEDPKQSGVVRLKPTVIKGIDGAFTMFQQYTAHQGVDVESLQHGELVQGDFAGLVATQIGGPTVSFPKQYLPRDVPKLIKMQARNIIKRLRTRYEFWPNPAGGAPKYIAQLVDS